ncbi:MAG TPA: amidohydrolase family protein [Bryobacteraceae bacterium]|nr:amidohydrolase family protein [Bryobacteraceae bacterium]
MKSSRRLWSTLGVLLGIAWLLSAMVSGYQDASNGVKAFVGARIIDGSGAAPVTGATLLVRNGRIEAVGPSVKIPAGAERIDASGKTIIPGLINGHGHVNDLSQLGKYARYGVTTVFSLGGNREIELRDQTRAQQQTAALSRARLYIAGPIPVPKTPDEARQAVDALAAAKTDIVKFRLDDNLGRGAKIPLDAYTAIIEEAHKQAMRVAVHAVYLADVKSVLRLGADYIAHSVRDFEIDDETIALLRKNNAFYCPTLMREVSTFIYAEKPAFLMMPFVRKEAEPAELAKAEDPAFQETMRNDSAAKWYKEHLPIAMRNLKRLEDAGVPIVMGTDTGVAYRFQGAFEHFELEYMVKAGLTPMQALVAATSQAARALKASDQIGTLQPGRWADLLILNGNPLDDIANTQKIDSVWVAGNRISLTK